MSDTQVYLRLWSFTDSAFSTQIFSHVGRIMLILPLILSTILPSQQVCQESWMLCLMEL